MDKQKFICPLCGARLTMYESFEEYRDEETLILTEHYECQECRNYDPPERIATYHIEKESWSE